MRWYRTGTREPTGESRADLGSASADGRYIVFSSTAPDVVPGDTALCARLGERRKVNCSDVFLYDRVRKATAMVSMDAGGRPREHDTSDAVLSGDGRRVAFTLRDPPEAGFSRWRGILKDLVTGSETVVTPSGTNGSPCAISHDGRFVTSVASYEGNQTYPYVRDTRERETMSLSEPDTNPGEYGMVYCPAISGDGHVVAWWVVHRNQASDPETRRLYVRDLRTGFTEVAPVPHPPLNPSVGLSWNGERVAFYNAAPPEMPETNTSPDQRLHVWDRTTQATTEIAITCDYDETSNDYHHYSCPRRVAWSRDGRHLAFSAGTVLAPGAKKDATNIYRYDFATRTTILVSRNPAGSAANDENFLAGISADGNVVVFASFATDLVSGDARSSPCRTRIDAVDACLDVFVRDVRAGVTVRASGRAT